MSKAKLAVAIIAASVASVVLMAVSFVGLNIVLAQVAPGSYSTLVNNIATKFNLKPADVQAVFNDTRVQQESARLDKAVAAGKITADQKTLILNKQADLKTQLDAINNKQITEAERQTELQQVLSDLQKWETDNKIPAGLVMMGGGFRGGPGFGLHSGMGRGPQQ